MYLAWISVRQPRDIWIAGSDVKARADHHSIASPLLLVNPSDADVINKNGGGDNMLPNDPVDDNNMSALSSLGDVDNCTPTLDIFLEPVLGDIALQVCEV
jgi:hypothetical protein